MIQYTTPTVGVRVKTELDPTYDYQLTIQPVDKVSKKPKGEKTEFDTPNVRVADGFTYVTVKLTQAQSAAFPVGTIKMQANWKVDSNTRGASKPVYLKVEPNLHAQQM